MLRIKDKKQVCVIAVIGDIVIWWIVSLPAAVLLRPGSTGPREDCIVQLKTRTGYEPKYVVKQIDKYIDRKYG